MRSVAVLLLTLSLSAFGKTFSLMTYNVENLFDTTHDPGKNDYTYLPLDFKNSSREVQEYCSSISNDYYRESCFNYDWNENVLNVKIKNLAKVISSAKGSSSPDILVLQEVENINVLRMLVEKGLYGEGYQSVSLLEGPDSRGIDVAIVSKYPIIKEMIHRVDLDGVAKETRGILQAVVKVGRKTVSVFANHWPSQSNPSEARYIAAETLLKAARRSNSDAVIAAGDFNTIAQDAPHGINEVIMPNFYSADEEAKRRGYRVAEGCHWYRGEWGFLDKIFILKNKTRSIKPLYSSFKVHKQAWMLKRLEWTDWDTGRTTVHHVPWRFDEKTGQGYADHLPLVMSFAF